jgi:hypothetical protein
MASISYYHRYVKHQYTFPWSERYKWVSLLQRFHIVFSSTWSFITKDDKGNRSTDTFTLLDSMNGRDVDNLIKKADKTVAPQTTVTVRVAGTAFWGAMPPAGRIDWSKLPPCPTGEVPRNVASFAKCIVSMGSIVGNHTDLGHMWDFTEYEKNPVSTIWFPYIIRQMREAKSYHIRTLYYAPSTETMYVLVRSNVENSDVMIVKFNSTSAAPAADVPFDLDDGFGDQATKEMDQDFLEWSADHARDPALPLLKLLAPYDVMFLD